MPDIDYDDHPALTALALADRVPVWDDDADAARKVTLDNLLGIQAPLGKLIGADLNSTADQAIDIPDGVGSYILDRIVVTNASTTPATAAGGVYAATSKAGTILVAASQAYTALTASSKLLDLTLTADGSTTVLTADPLYLSLTTAEGSALTADLYLFGRVLS